VKRLILRTSFLVLGSMMVAGRPGYAQMAPPSISKAFGATRIPLLVPTSLTFTISNPNSGVSLTGVAFTDDLPPGLFVAAPNGLNGSCGGGTITADEDSATISLSGATLTAASSCTFSVNVRSPVSGGVLNNTTGNVTSTNGGTGNTASAHVTAVIPAVPDKVAFGAATIPLNGTTSLSFTIRNPNSTVTLTGVSLSDSLPAGLVVATPNGLNGSCGGGTITAVAGSAAVSLSGATLATTESCTFSVNITGTTPGLKTNIGSVTSTEGVATFGFSASITVLATTATPTNTPINSPTSTSTPGPTGTPIPRPVVPMLDGRGTLIFGLLVAGTGLLLLIRWK